MVCAVSSPPLPPPLAVRELISPLEGLVQIPQKLVKVLMLASVWERWILNVPMKMFLRTSFYKGLKVHRKAEPHTLVIFDKFVYPFPLPLFPLFLRPSFDLGL